MKFWSKYNQLDLIDWDEEAQVKKYAQKLIDADINLNAHDSRGLTMLMHASYKGYKDVVKILLENGANSNLSDRSEKTALMWAKSPEVIKLLVQYGANLEARDLMGRTPLIHAVQKGDERNVRVLAACGADPNIGDNEGKTPIIYASFLYSDSDIIHSLIQSGSDITVRNQNDETPLMMVSAHGDLESMQVLLENGANPNARNRQGHTSLMIAAMRGNKDAAEILLLYGANPNLKDYLGKTADVLAVEKGFNDVANFLADPIYADKAEHKRIPLNFHQRLICLENLFNGDLMRHVFLNRGLRLEILSVVRNRLKKQEINRIKEEKRKDAKFYHRKQLNDKNSKLILKRKSFVRERE